MFATCKKRIFALVALSLGPRRRNVHSASSLEPVRVESRGPVHVIGLNRPSHRNAVNKATAELLYQAFTQFESDPSLHVAVLHGVGETFCAGYDLKELAKAGDEFTLPGPEDIGGVASPMVGTSFHALPSLHPSLAHAARLPSTPSLSPCRVPHTWCYPSL